MGAEPNVDGLDSVRKLAPVWTDVSQRLENSDNNLRSVAQMAVAAVVLLDKHGVVQIDAQDLPGTLARLFAAERKFGIRLQSTGDEANVTLKRIVMQTLFVSSRKPCLVTFDQFILTPFTGLGQFDLVERDSSDIDVFDSEGELVSGGESEVVIATKSGFTNGVTTSGHSRLVKVNTVNKTYSVNFVPGTVGDGIYSIRVRELKIFSTQEAAL